MFESNVNSGKVWEVRLVKQSWNSPFWGRLPPFRCLWLEKEWFLPLADSVLLESWRAWVAGNMEERKRRENLEGYVRNPRNELYIEGLLVSEMMLYLIASLSGNSRFILFCFFRMASSRWCVIVTFQPSDETRTSKTSYKDVSLIFAFNGSWEAYTKIVLIAFQMRSHVK